jgi:hypothetical protein
VTLVTIKGRLKMAHRWSEPFAADVAGGRDFEPFLFGDRPISEAIDRARTWLSVAGTLALIIGILSVAVSAGCSSSPASWRGFTRARIAQRSVASTP